MFTVMADNGTFSYKKLPQAINHAYLLAQKLDYNPAYTKSQLSVIRGGSMVIAQVNAYGCKPGPHATEGHLKAIEKWNKAWKSPQDEMPPINGGGAED